MFQKLKGREAILDDWQTIYLSIQYHDPNCPEISDLNDEEMVISWINIHYNEYEPLIFSILKTQNI